MIFTFDNGDTKSFRVGSNIRGLNIKGQRPVSITLTKTEIWEIQQHPEYLHTIHMCMNVKQVL